LIFQLRDMNAARGATGNENCADYCEHETRDFRHMQTPNVQLPTTNFEVGRWKLKVANGRARVVNVRRNAAMPAPA
jgi:hypothetical protein